MNCKPNDLAYIIHPAMYGQLVTVIEAAPARDFRLPGGVLSIAGRPGDWVCESMGAEFATTHKTSGGALMTVLNRFAVIPDKCLRPIRPQSDDATDESAAWLPPVPSTQQVAA